MFQTQNFIKCLFFLIAQSILKLEEGFTYHGGNNNMKTFIYFLLTFLISHYSFLTSPQSSYEHNDFSSNNKKIPARTKESNRDAIDYDLISSKKNKDSSKESLNNSVVYTPNATEVPAIYNEVDGTEEEFDSVNQQLYIYNMMFPNNVTIEGPDTRYNCHSFAWHSQIDDENFYWIDDPSAYYTDGSYTETTSPSIGDRLCYFTANNEIIHSSIIYSINSSSSLSSLSTYTVTSKWGSLSVFRHLASDCIYYTSSTIGYSYFKIYTYSHTNHNYNHTYTWKDYNSHYSNCACNNSVIQPHIVSSTSQSLGQYKKCLLCNGLAKVGFVGGGLYTFNKKNNSYGNDSYYLENGVLVLGPIDYQLFLENNFSMPRGD